MENIFQKMTFIGLSGIACIFITGLLYIVIEKFYVEKDYMMAVFLLFGVFVLVGVLGNFIMIVTH